MLNCVNAVEQHMPGSEHVATSEEKLHRDSCKKAFHTYLIVKNVTFWIWEWPPFWHCYRHGKISNDKSSSNSRGDFKTVWIMAIRSKRRKLTFLRHFETVTETHNSKALTIVMWISKHKEVIFFIAWNATIFKELQIRNNIQNNSFIGSHVALKTLWIIAARSKLRKLSFWLFLKLQMDAILKQLQTPKICREKRFSNSCVDFKTLRVIAVRSKLRKLYF